MDLRIVHLLLLDANEASNVISDNQSLLSMDSTFIHDEEEELQLKPRDNGVLIVVDIQEVIGNTIAIKIWSNDVGPIRAGVLITTLD
ncbi:hypothetical protein Tco_0957889, partial [Tanacetum coccineum]